MRGVSNQEGLLLAFAGTLLVGSISISIWMSRPTVCSD